MDRILPWFKIILPFIVIAKANRLKVLPAFLWHIKELASGLQQPKDSSLIIMEVDDETTKRPLASGEQPPVNTPVVKVCIMLLYLYCSICCSLDRLTLSCVSSHMCSWYPKENEINIIFTINVTLLWEQYALLFSD